MTRLMGVSGAESLDVAASIFMGQTEAPLTIRPFLSRLTRSEMMTVMTAGMAHVSGGIMAAYIATGVEAKHLLGAVIMTAPGTLLIAKTLVPETETPVSGRKVDIVAGEEDKHSNVLGAIARGTGRRPQPGLECRSDAHRVPGPYRAIKRSHGMGARIDYLVSVQLAKRPGLALRAGGLADWHSLERRDPYRLAFRHPHGGKRTDRLRATGRFESAN